MRKKDALYAINDEYDEAAKHFPVFASYHEGKAIIEEELEELWDEIKAKPHPGRKGNLKREAIQVGAMALRFLIDLC